jgi:hypothetical protein
LGFLEGVVLVARLYGPQDARLHCRRYVVYLVEVAIRIVRVFNLRPPQPGDLRILERP